MDADLRELLFDLAEYFDQRADAEQFTDSPRQYPNEEMRLLERIRTHINSKREPRK